MNPEPPTLIELDRLHRVRAAGRYTPYTSLEKSGLQALALCGWVREVATNVWELTEAGQRLFK